jgi:iron complex outermembrane receptor protein
LVAGGLSLEAGMLAERARITDERPYPRDGVPTDIYGYQLPDAPDWTATLGLEQRFSLPNHAAIVAKVQSYLSSSYWLDFTHDLNTRQDSYTSTSIDLSYVGQGGWEVGAFVRNVENSAVYGGANKPDPLAPAAVFLGPPRTYGVRFRYAPVL